MVRDWPQLNVRMERELLEKLRDAAAEKRLTMAELIRWAAAEWLERHG